jgi:trk system potassium uptake protein TrkA
VEFDVDACDHRAIRRPLREAAIPADSKVASIIRGGVAIVPSGDQSIQDGDRIIVIGSPDAARDWSQIIAGGRRRLDDVVIFGAGRIGVAVADTLLQQNIRVRLLEADPDRAREAAELLPRARVFRTTGIDPDFLDRERIGRARAAIFAMRDDTKNHYAATLARLHGVDFTIAIAHETVSMEVFDSDGVDVSINPRQLTAEELVRFAHDPRTEQVAMLEGDRYEVLDVTVRPDSQFANRRFGDMPKNGALIGAIVRNGKAIFPHGGDTLLPGDRVIVFTEAQRASWVESVL